MDKAFADSDILQDYNYFDTAHDYIFLEVDIVPVSVIQALKRVVWFQSSWVKYVMVEKNLKD